MVAQDTVLSIDTEAGDYLYRIKREDDAHGSRIVYVLLKPSSLIPEQCRTSGPSFIQQVSKLDEWQEPWKTLTLSKDQPLLDDFPPHSLSKEVVPVGYKLYDLFTLQDVKQVKHRTCRFQESGTQCYMKIARFGFEIQTLKQEVRAYLTLTALGTNLAPKLLGFVYEETPDRIVGLVMEAIEGRRPTPVDFEMCSDALEELHRLGIIHGDINNHNIIIHADGVRFIDFEDAYIRTSNQDRSWAWRTSLEMQVLKDRLFSESDVGRPDI